MPKRKRSWARFDTWARAEICTLREEGYAREDIRKRVKKTDGQPGHMNAIDGILAKKAECPEWRGENSVAGGWPRALTNSQLAELKNLGFKMT